MKAKRTLIAIIALTLLAALSAGCGRHEDKPPMRPEVKGVKMETLALRPAPVIYETNGTIKAETLSTLASRVMGEIRQVHVNEGQRIRKGQLLVTIDDRDMAQRVRAAEKGREEAKSMLESAKEQLSLAEKIYARMKGLHDNNAIAEQDFDRAATELKVRTNALKMAEAALERAQSGLEEARLYQGYTKVTAPIDSIVIKKHADSGSMAAPGSPLITIEDPSAFKLEVNVDARYQNAIKVGTIVEVGFPSLEKSCMARVARVVPSINPATRTFPVELKSEGSRPEGLRTGLYAKVKFAVSEANALLVPEQAVERKGQLEGVYVVSENNVVVYRLIRTGSRHMGMVEVVSGLNEGDRVITAGIANAIDGGVIKD